MTEIVVIGGGVVGAAAAYRLARDGVRATLIDRVDPGQATAAGAGIICPGTSLRPLPAFYPFAAAAVAHYPALVEALAVDGAPSTGYETVGELLVATDDAAFEQLPELLALFQARRATGMPNLGEVSAIDDVEARERFPALGDVFGALWVPEAARVDGRLLRDALRHAALGRGVTMLQGEATLVRNGVRISAVRVGDRTVACDAVIIAGGAWSNAFGAVLDVVIPVEPQRGQILHLTLPGVETGHWPIVTGMRDHYLLTFPPNRVVAGATRETGSGYDPRMTAGGMHEALSEALRVAPGLAGATLGEVRIGLRPLSPDGLPLLGPVPGLTNAYLATGHGPSGLQLGPYSGEVVARLAQRRSIDPGLDLAPFAVGRFTERVPTAPTAGATR